MTCDSVFSTRFDELLPLAARRAARVVADPDLADDVAVDVLVELHMSAGRFDPARGSVEALVATVASRRAVDRVRSEQARRDRQARSMRQAVLVADGPDATVEQDELVATVRAAVDRLPDHLAVTIQLTWLGTMTYAEAAAWLGWPEGTFKSRAASALRRLRGCVELAAVS